MDLVKKRKDCKLHSKKDKKLKKLINVTESDSDESEQELSYYLNDRVKLMKEVLKIIKPKKINSMAPNCLKKLDQGEINSMLLEELLGISNKRLKYIFNGQNLEEDSSSTDPEIEQQPIDVISLDDITDDDFVIDLDSDSDKEKKCHKKHNKPKIKEECKRKKVKKEKHDKNDYSKLSKKSKEMGKDKMDEQNLMSVLELLELQARARAIRSQLALENNKKSQGQERNKTKTEESDNDDAVIIESPKNIEIVITSSESENEDSARITSKRHRNVSENQRSSGGIGNKKTGNDLRKISFKEKETSINTCAISNEEINHEQDSINDKDCDNLKNRNDKRSTSEFINKSGIDVEKYHETKDMEIKRSALQEDENLSRAACAQSKNKIINIETVIITPAKKVIVAGADIDNGEVIETSGENKIEDKNSEDSEKGKTKTGNEKTKLTSQSENNVKSGTKDDSSKSESYEESDGIIIIMEQSEIDCIISD